MTEVAIKCSDFVSYPQKCLKFIGIDRPGYDETLSQKLLKLWFSIGMIGMAATVLFSSVYTKEHYDDLNLLTENVLPPCYNILAIFKAMSIFLRRKQFFKVSDTLEELFPSSRDKNEADFVRKYLREYKRIEKLFMYLFGSLLVMFIAVPLMKGAATGIWIDKLPYENWYPFNQLNPILHTFAFFFESIVFVMQVAIIQGSDLSLYAFIGMLAMQFNILCDQLRALKPGPTRYQDFVKLVKLHDTLISIADSVESIYSFMILSVFLGSSFFICLIGYQAALGGSLENLIKYAMILINAMLQVFILCNHGTKLTSASERVADAAYYMEWNDEEILKMKNPLILIMQRSQKPSYITAYKFSVVSLEAFGSVSSH